jgi:3-oxoacyl-[acyl-carrier protein] reductase
MTERTENPEGSVLVTGASSDIGIALVRALVGEGRTVVAHVRSGARVLREEAERAKGRIFVVEADLRDEAQTKGLVATARECYGDPSGFVHLPALPLELKRFHDLDWSRLSADLDVQLRAAMLIMQAIVPPMKRASRRGKIVLMLSSVTLGVPPRSMGSYVIAKYAMLGLLRAVAAEYADKNVCVNAVSPSTVGTKFLAEVPEKFVEICAEQNPMKRNATPADVVPLLSFLLSPASDYLNGANIPVAGGSVF